jgi:hypothetical protein
MTPTHPADASTSAGQRDQGAKPTTQEDSADDLDAYIKDLVDHAPPLSREQRDKLALILNPHRRTQ